MKQFYKSEPRGEVCRIGLKQSFVRIFREIIPSKAILHFFEALRVTSNPKDHKKSSKFVIHFTIA